VKLVWRALLLLSLLAAGVTSALARQPAATSADCAFPFTPTAYEDLKDRSLFLNTIELASFNMLFPGQPYFGLPPLEVGPRGNRHHEPGKIPPILLKSVAWIESSITQAAVQVPFGAIGPALVSFDCGHGITQVTTGMTAPQGEDGRGTPEQALVATHFAYNIARGAYILAEKWNEAPEKRPVAGLDTNGHPGILENWYFALWGYNGFTGPGTNRSNHPMDPIYGTWPRAPYSCGPNADGKGHNRANYPYQELVYGCVMNPPVVDGKPLWQAQPVTLPDLNNPAWKEPLRLENFVFPYAKMDITTPQPFHIDPSSPPNPELRAKVLGAPKMEVTRLDVKVGFAPNGGSTVEVVEIVNAGTGVLAWYAIPSVPWLNVTPYAGSAVGSDLPCAPESPCDRPGRMQISVDSSKAPAGKRTVQVTVQALGMPGSIVINVEVAQVVRLGAPGISKN